ncbi:outer membrane lipoprotein carrier protein LolA [Fibrobacterota bacterium]
MLEAVQYYSTARSLVIEFKADMYWSATEEWNPSQGKLWLWGKNQFHLFLPEIEVVSDGKTLWKYSRENKQVVVENFEDSGESTHPSQILFEFLQCEPLSLERIREKKRQYYRIVLDASKHSRNFDSLVVYLDPKSHAPQVIKTLDAAENRSIYRIRKMKRDVGFKKKDFVFSIPKGVEVVDVRE